MENIYIVWIILFILIGIEQKKEREFVGRIIKSKHKKENNEMLELAKRFIDKECIIYTFNSQQSGVIKEVTNGAILVEREGNTEAVNLDFVVRIREYPKKKNGKKKSVVVD